MNKNLKNKKNDKENYIIAIICILIFCLGFLARGEFYFYLFGLIFFITGVFAAIKEKGLGLFFLFSHALTGLIFMVMHLLDVDSIIYIDASNRFLFIPNLLSNIEVATSTKLYLLLICVTFLIAIIYTIIYNISDKLKKDKSHIIKIFVFYLVGFILCYMVSILFPNLYK